MKYTHVIWDFNGTLLNDVDIGIQSINVLLSARGLPVLATPDAYREVSGFPIVEYYKRIGFDFSKESYDDVALEWVEQYMRRADLAQLYDGALSVLKSVRERGLRQILLSATELSMLQGQVAALGIENYFDEICGMDNVYAYGKRTLAERWRGEHPEAKALMIGDTDHDSEVAEAMGADCLLFCKGHQSRERLGRIGRPVIDSLAEILIYL